MIRYTALYHMILTHIATYANAKQHFTTIMPSYRPYNCIVLQQRIQFLLFDGVLSRAYWVDTGVFFIEIEKNGGTQL